MAGVVQPGSLTSERNGAKILIKMILRTESPKKITIDAWPPMRDRTVHISPFPAGENGALLWLAACAVLFSIGCAKTFLLSKDCNTYFFGSNNETLHQMLCTAGDLEKVLSDSQLPQDVKAGLYRAQCVERTREAVDTMYASLAPEQQEALKSAFRKHGYEINIKPAPNFHIYPYYDNVNFCPPEQHY
jgi:hypothetical protein